MGNNDDLVMNADGAAKLGFPMWPQFAPEVAEAIAEPIKSGLVNYWTGKRGMEFERDFAVWEGSAFAISCTNGTAALHIALASLGIGPGDEVIVPSYSFIASSFGIVQAGAIPIFSDVTKEHTLDPKGLGSLVSSRTKAIVVVHMRGVPCDMDAIMAIAEKHDLRVIEDVAQALGGTYKGKMLGTFGDCGCFSFQYHKTITAGEGGMIITKDPRLLDRCKGYHDTAACWRPDRFAEQRYEGELFAGTNYRMSELTGAVLLAQLRKLDHLLLRMRSNQRRIIDQIRDVKGIKVRPSYDEKGDTGICIMFYLPKANLVQPFAEALSAEGVPSAGVFNSGLPDWHIYAHWTHILEKKTPTPEGCPWTCPYHKGPEVEYSADMNPNTLEYLSRVIHLDVPPQMSDEDCDLTAKAIKKVAAALL